jgi:type I restriction enzyme S subunit
MAASNSPAEQLITENIDIWTSAIKKRGSQGRGSSKKIELYGIKKLRELILELAVRGLLVPQDPSDEPASVLLEKIAAVKELLIKDGQIKKQKTLPDITDKERFSKLPSSWSCQRITDVFYPISVSKNKIKTSEILEKGKIPVVDQGQSFIAGYTDKEDLEILLPGAVIVFGDHTSALKYVNFNFVAGADGVKILRPISINEEYFFLVSKTLPIENRGYGRHYSRFIDNLFPIPPEAEQPRIVAKVDELMALCDQLEQQTESSLSAHQTLVETLLNTLLNADQNSFDQAWERIAQHFDVLFTTEHSIDQLKQTILQLAVMGKLVPQDPNDEPASVLLEKIAAEKEQLIKDKVIKKQKPLPPISEDEKPFELPKGWEWCRIWDVAKIITSGSRDWAKYYSESGPIFVTMGNLSRGHYKLRTDKLRYVNPPKEGEGNRTRLEESDLLISITGDVGNLGLIPSGFGESYINQHTALLRFMPEYQDRFLPEVMRSPLAKFQFDAPQRGIKNSFRLGDVGEMVVPIAPTFERARIVDKIDELMTLCEILTQKIKSSQIVQLHLADAMAEKALN